MKKRNVKSFYAGGKDNFTNLIEALDFLDKKVNIFLSEGDHLAKGNYSLISCEDTICTGGSGYMIRTIIFEFEYEDNRRDNREDNQGEEIIKKDKWYN